MDWNRGFLSTFYASFIDPNTWGDIERFEIIDGSVSKSDDRLRESANLKCVRYQGFTERWIRIWMDTSQSGGSGHTPLFTGIAVNPTRSFDGVYETNNLTCYSVLKPIDDILLPRGWYVTSVMDLQEVISDLMKPAKAPLTFAEDIPQLADEIIAEDGETNLSMVDKLLDAIKWRMTIDGYGRISFKPTAVDGNNLLEQPKVKYDAIENDVVELSVEVKRDWFESPNVFRAILDGLTAIARDEDPDSIYSTVSRGREIWMEETNCILKKGETLADYASRRLKEEQRIAYTVSYKHRFNPDAMVTDLVSINYPSIDVNGIFLIKSQNINFSDGASISEEACLIG